MINMFRHNRDFDLFDQINSIGQTQTGRFSYRAIEGASYQIESDESADRKRRSSRCEWRPIGEFGYKSKPTGRPVVAYKLL